MPMTIAYMSTPLIGIVDIAVIGQLGDAALIGAVALGALLFDFLGAALNFLRSGTTGLVAQAVGAEDREAEAMALWRALLLALLAGLAILALHQPLDVAQAHLGGAAVVGHGGLDGDLHMFYPPLFVVLRPFHLVGNGQQTSFAIGIPIAYGLVTARRCDDAFSPPLEDARGVHVLPDNDEFAVEIVQFHPSIRSLV